MQERTTDKEQIEMLKKWWRDYGRGIAIAVVIGVLVGYGWRYYHRVRQAHVYQASSFYETLLDVPAKNQAAYIAHLRKDYHGTVYAELGALIAAKNAVTAKHYSAALTVLDGIVTENKLPALTQIAALRKARILLAQKQPKKALSAVSVVYDHAYLPFLLGIRGDANHMMGHQQQAMNLYRQAKKALQDSNFHAPFLSMKAQQ